ncbi:MAG: transposase [Xylophilus ampelinus]
MLDERLHPGRRAAACVAHARRKFDELAEADTSLVGDEAIRRFAGIYAVERALAGLSDEARRNGRQALARPLWEQLGAWLQLERQRVADGGSTAAAIGYTLRHWTALTHHLDDGAAPIDNNHLERQIKPWAMGRKAWMFVGSELAGQHAAMVMSLVQSARMCGCEPWAYLRYVLQQLPTQLNSQIEGLLPHSRHPA